nr:tetratricopeptide repeat protein [Arthrospira sp. SH-MAG29]
MMLSSRLSQKKKVASKTDPISHYRHLLEASPNNPDLHQELGQLLHSQGQTQLAIAHYQKAIDLQPGPVHLWFYRNLGEAMLTTDQHFRQP